jgi:hypothetical protein
MKNPKFEFENMDNEQIHAYLCHADGVCPGDCSLGDVAAIPERLREYDAYLDRILREYDAYLDRVDGQTGSSSEACAARRGSRRSR